MKIRKTFCNAIASGPRLGCEPRPKPFSTAPVGLLPLRHCYAPTDGPLRAPLDNSQPKAKDSKHLPHHLRRWTQTSGGMPQESRARFVGGLAPTRKPRIYLGLQRVNRTAFPMKLPADRQVFVLLPTLRGAHFPLQVNCYFFPRVEALPVRLQPRWNGCSLYPAHSWSTDSRHVRLPQIHFTLFQIAQNMLR